jgi:GAF domain-containing protein/GGDEF domain-containing protein
MAEFIIRIVATLGIGFGLVSKNAMTTDTAAKAAGVLCTIWLMIHLLERRGLRTSGLSSLVAIIDCVALAFALAAIGKVGSFAFLCLIPCAVAVAKHGVQPSLLAPLSGCAIYSAGQYSAQPLSQPLLLATSAGVAVMVYVCTPKIKIVEHVVEREVQVQAPADGIIIDPDFAQQHFELREKYRQLRSHYQNLEERSRIDRVRAQIVEAALASGDTLQIRLTQKLRELTGLSAVSLYTVSESNDQMIVRATSGDLPARMATTSVPIQGAFGETGIRNRFDQWLRSIKTTEDASVSKSVLLKNGAKVVGIICLTDAYTEHIEKGLRIAELAAPTVAQFLEDEDTTDKLTHRARQAELIYDLATVTSGSESTLNLLRRVVREFWPTQQFDHLSIQLRDGDQSLTAASEGVSTNLFSAIHFGPQAGLAGWIQAGAPEVHIADTSTDDRIDRKVALQKRIGSYAVVPIWMGQDVLGFLCAGSHRAGAIDLQEMEALRTIAAEVGHAVSRLENQSTGAGGLMTPSEFFEKVQASTEGCLVKFEPLHVDSLVQDFGKSTVDHALATFARKLKSMMPSGALVCRRSEGDYLAFLPDTQEPFARNWANQVCVTASLIALKAPDGKTRVPLGLQAKVSEYSVREPVATPATTTAVVAMPPVESVDGRAVVTFSPQRVSPEEQAKVIRGVPRREHAMAGESSARKFALSPFENSKT